jgi:hypothetical protein
VGAGEGSGAEIGVPIRDGDPWNWEPVDAFHRVALERDLCEKGPPPRPRVAPVPKRAHPVRSWPLRGGEPWLPSGDWVRGVRGVRTTIDVFVALLLGKEGLDGGVGAATGQHACLLEHY